MERRISRRDFLKLIPISAAAAETFILTGCDFQQSQKDFESSHKISDLITQIFGIDNFYFGGQIYIGSQLSAEGLSPPFGYQRATRVTSAIYDVFCYYPPDIFQNLNLISWNYLLAEDLKTQIGPGWYSVDGSLIGSTKEGFNICINNNNYENTSNIIDSTHHELFHLITATLVDAEGEIYQPFREINLQYGYPAYNETANFVIAASCQDPPDDPPEGFARCYGEWKPQEDAATIAAALMQSDPLFLQRTHQEPGLNEKTKIIKNTYEQASNGKMNSSFFDWLAIYPNKAPWSWPKIPEEILNN